MQSTAVGVLVGKYFVPSLQTMKEVAPKESLRVRLKLGLGHFRGKERQ